MTVLSPFGRTARESREFHFGRPWHLPHVGVKVGRIEDGGLNAQVSEVRLPEVWWAEEGRRWREV